MKQLIFIFALFAGLAAAQTTSTITGTINDLTGSPVTSGKVTFTLRPSADTTMSGIARFTPSTVTCVLNGSGQVKALDGTSPCVVTMNAALQPTGSYYSVAIWPGNVKTSTFNFYAINSSYDLSTIVPTPTTSPAQNFVDTFSNQTVGGQKVFTSPVTLTSPILASPTTTGTDSGVETLTNKTISGNVPGNPDFTQGITTQSIGPIQFADLFVAGDCGARINLADAALGSNAGEIWATTSCGTNITTAINLSTKHTLRFMQGATYQVGALITMGQKATITGPPAAAGTGVALDTQVVLQQANGQNLPKLIQMGALSTIENITVDGNKSANTTTNCISIVDAGRPNIRFSSIQNCPGNNILISSTGAGDLACCGKLVGVFLYGAVLDNISCTGTTDWNIGEASEIEAAAGYGIELSDCSGWRIHDSDFGTNALDGLYVHGTLAGPRANAEIITGNQFGSNGQNDIRIVGYDTVGGGFVSGSHVVQGNSFIGGGTTRTPDNTYDALNLIDSNNNTVTGNLLSTNVAPHSNKCGVELTETSAGRANGDTGQGNTYNGNFSTGKICNSTTSDTGWISARLTATATLTFGAILANACAEQPITIAGATTAGAVNASPSTNLGNIGLQTSARVSGVNTVQAKVCNITAGSLTPTAVAWTATVTQP